MLKSQLTYRCMISINASWYYGRCIKVVENAYLYSTGQWRTLLAQKEWVGWKSWFASATEGEGFGEGLAPLPNLENFEKMKPILPSFHVI